MLKKLSLILILLLLCEFIGFSQWIPVNGMDGDEGTWIELQDSTLLFSGYGSGIASRNIGDTSWKQILNHSIWSLHGVENKAIIGFESMGICHRSFDQGNSWETLDMMIIAPSRFEVIDSVVFISGSTGVFKSLDYCSTWIPLVNDSSGSEYYRIYSDSHNLYFHRSALTSLYISGDYGATFDSVPMTGFPGSAFDISDVSVFNLKYWLCSHYGLFCFNPASQSWELISDSLIFNSMNQIGDQFYGAGKGVWRLTSGEEEWVDCSSGLGLASVSNVTGSENRIYCTGNTGCYFLDEDQQWQRYNTGLHGFYIRKVCAHGNEVWTCTQDELYYSGDRGSSFSRIDHDFENQLVRVAVNDTAVYLATSGNLFVSLDHGDTWESLTTTFPVTNLQISDFALGSKYIYLYCSNYPHGYFYRSEYSDIQWESLDNSIVANGRALTASDSIVLIGGNSSGNQIGAYISRENGENISPVDLYAPGQYPVAVKAVDNRFYLASGNTVFYSEDGTLSWESSQLDNPVLISTDISGNSECIAACGYMYEYTPLVTLSYDHGLSWYNIGTDLAELLSNAFTCVEISGNRLFLGSCFNGLWYRDDLLTGLNQPEQTLGNCMKIWPVPASDQVSIKLDTGYPCCGDLWISDMLGKPRSCLTNLMLNTGSNTFDIDVSAFPSGIYFARFISGNFNCSSRFIVQH